MSVSQFPKSSPATDSSIPVRRKSNTGLKKTRKCAQLPELQKYIETIIKASNDYAEDSSGQPDKDKFPKERKFGNYSVYKGHESKAKPEKSKNQLNVSGSKSSIKSKTTNSDAVSRGLRVCSTFAPEFEDPRNWKLDKTTPHSLGPSVEIEKFLKKFYPNPYHLETVNEFKKPENDKGDELRDGTLPDVVISQPNIHTEVDIEKTDTELQTADNEPCKRENKCLNPDSDTNGVETQSVPRHQNKIPDAKTAESNAVSIAALPKTLSKAKSINSMSNASSRASSVENVKEAPSRESQFSLRKRKTIKTKSKSLKTDIVSDYDIGKLKLLSISDSEHSISQTGMEKPNVTFGDIEISPGLCEEIYKTEDFNDLKEIYDIMYKATESFLQISAKSQNTDYTKTFLESQMLTRKPNTKPDSPELNENLELINALSITKLELSKSDKTEDGTHETEDREADDSNTITIEVQSAENEPIPTQKSLINVLLSDENLEYRYSPEGQKPEQVHDQAETEPNYGAALLEGASRANAPEDKNDFTDTNEKTDELLDFMYDCLKKINNNEKSPTGDEKKTLEDEKSLSYKGFRTESVMDLNYEKPLSSGSFRPTDFAWNCQESTDSLLEKTFPDIKDIKNKYSAALGEINRKVSRTRFKKRPAFNGTGSFPHYQIPSAELHTPGSSISQSSYFQQSTEVNAIEPLITVQMAESQNELGSFAEEHNGSIILNDENRASKPICPLSVKPKKSKSNSGKILKDALEAEEKLLSDEKNAKQTEEKMTDETVSSTADEVEVQTDADKHYSRLSDFKRPSSNFVNCVNSLPRNLRNAMTIRANNSVPDSETEPRKKWNSKQLQVPSKFPLRKHFLSLEEGCYVLEHTSIRQEILLTMSKTAVAYTARPVSLKTITNLSKPVEELSLKSSECLVTVMNLQHIVPEAENTPEYQVTPQITSEDDKPVKAFIEAIEETEEKLYLLEQSSAENLYTRNSEMFSLSASETLKNEFSENENEKVNDRKKVHHLLLRTYNLQQKLQRYLQKLTYDQPKSASCVLMQQEGVIDCSLRNKTRIEFGIMSESSLPLVHWHMKPPDVISKANESIKVNVLMVDHSTSYDPPMEETSEKVDEPNREKFGKEKGERYPQDSENEEDDRSSNCSFKSSNDYSDPNEAKPIKDKEVDYMDNMKLFQKIYTEIESIRQSFEAEKLEKQQRQQQQQQQGEATSKPPEEPVERRLTQYDPKTPAKVLRTVFTGTKSSTELTIGLKGVPMTKLGNISVEKTKFSPNHTKISVAFTRESSVESNKLSSYLFDNMRSSLSTCITEYSGLKDGVSKTSQSLNVDSEDDEDDYKSVGSTLDNSDMEAEEQKCEPKEEKTVETSTPKTFTKHRFDFYQKMNTDLDSIQSKPKSTSSPICKYKELEPLKQALTDMQIRMRSIRRDAIFSSNDYYERALKLAKMSAGFCQNCGNRAVIPNDTFGYYRTLLPRRSTHNRRNRHFRSTLTPSPSFYSLHTGNVEVGDQFCDLGIKHNSYMLNPRLHSNRTVLRSSLHDMPILFERV